MCKAKLSTNVEKFVSLKAQIEELEAELKKVGETIIAQMDAEGVSSVESKESAKVTLVESTKVTYNDNIVFYLKDKAPNCVKETFDSAKVKTCIKAGVINEKDLDIYKKESKSRYLKLTK